MATVKSTQRRDLEKDIICSAGWCLAGAHLGGTWEHLGSIWGASGGGIRRHLGSILGSIRKHLGIILGASGYIWKHLEAYGNIWEASGSICKASGGIWEASGLLDGASPESRRRAAGIRRRAAGGLDTAWSEMWTMDSRRKLR